MVWQPARQGVDALRVITAAFAARSSFLERAVFICNAVETRTDSRVPMLANIRAMAQDHCWE